MPTLGRDTFDKVCIAQSESTSSTSGTSKYFWWMTFTIFVLVRAFHPFVIDRSQHLDSQGKLVFPYQTTSVLLCVSVCSCVLNFFRYFQEGCASLKRVFNPCDSLVYTAFGILYALEDNFEMEGIHGLSVVAYQILLQSKIVFNTLGMIVVRRQLQTADQLALLVILTLSASAYLASIYNNAQSSGKPFDAHSLSTGLRMTFAKIAISSVAYLIHRYCEGSDGFEPESCVAEIRISLVRVCVFTSLNLLQGWDLFIFSGWDWMTLVVLVLFIAKYEFTRLVGVTIDAKNIVIVILILVIYPLDMLARGREIQVEAFLSVVIFVVATSAARWNRESSEEKFFTPPSSAKPEKI